MKNIIESIGSSFKNTEEHKSIVGTIGSSFQELNKSQLSMFEEPKKVKEEISEKPYSIMSVGGRYASSDSRLKQPDLESKLASYNTHTNFLNNTKPEDKLLLNSIKKVHSNPDDIEEHFNKTTGRLQRYSQKPKHLQPSSRDTLIYHGNLSDDDWTLPSLSTNAKKELNRFSSGKEFDTAVRNGQVSSELNKYLKGYEAEHYNQGRKRRMFDNGDWIKPQGTDKSPLETFWEHPVGNGSGTSDKAVHEKDTPLFDLKKPDLLNEETKFKDYIPGEALNFAGQKHTVLKNGATVIKAIGQDGIERDIKKADLENIKHKPFNLDIHSEDFKNKLRGREADSLDTPENNLENVRESTAKKLKEHGFNDDELLHVHNYINSTKPNPKQYETGKKTRTALEKADLEAGNLSEEDIENIRDRKNKTEDFDHEKEYSEKAKDYKNLKDKYENIIDSHKENLTQKYHPYANPFYEEDKGNRRTVNDSHKLNIISPKHVKYAFEKSNEELTPGEVLNRLGIEQNKYTENEVRKVFTKMFESGELSKADKRNDNSEVRAIMGLSKSLFAQTSSYIEEKKRKILTRLRLLPQKETKTEEFIKSLSAQEVWTAENKSSEETKDFLRLMMLNITQTGISNRFEFYKNIAIEKSLESHAFLKRKNELERTNSFEEINKSILTESFTLTK